MTSTVTVVETKTASVQKPKILISPSLLSADFGILGAEAKRMVEVSCC